MKTSLLGILILSICPTFLFAGHPDSLWASEDLSIVKEYGSLLSISDSYKITMSKAAAGELRSFLNTYVKEREVVSWIKARARHPLGRVLVDLVAYNVGLFKNKLNTAGLIGDHGIISDVWIPKAGVAVCYPPLDIFGIQERISDTYWAVVDPWSWRIKTRP